ncbi:MAG: lipoyl(octanoyl) transferase LipB [Thermoplasmata archaeon]|nr:lipoyl(octanoyl) transferase LipB [Thermoplasmata archaeon]
MLSVVDWGLREYSDSLAAMHELVADRRAQRIPDTLVLVEHPPVVTVGIEGDDGAAAASGLPVVQVERGGRATYHAPGQLVAYPIVDLTPRGRDVRRFVHDVEGSVVESIAPFGVVGGHVPGRRGVWVEGRRKIASVGIAVEGWVTYHGVALNVDLDLAPFERFHPCGFEEPVMTSLAREAGREVRVADVKPLLAEAFREIGARAARRPSPPVTAEFAGPPTA